jgi:tRNA nucleotidyltransferase/poly(A) polymerase
MAFTYYKIGGCIRDELLGLKPNDTDYVAVCDDCFLPVELVFDELLNDIALRGKIFLVKRDCFTIRAKLGKEAVDIVLARKELGYTETSRVPASVPGSLGDDLARRDFTVNALARHPNGNVIDHFDGIEHLEAKLLVPIGGADRSLTDDPLRVLRAMRLCITKGFTMDADLQTTIACRFGGWEEAWKAKLSRERIENELKLCFKHDTLATLFWLAELRLNELCFSNGTWLMPTSRH